MKRKLFACFLALTMLTVLTACGGKAANSSASASADTSEAMVPDYTENDSYASYTGSDSGSGGFDETESLPTDAAEQKIIYTGDLNLETTDFDAATRSLSALAEELGGYVENSSIGSSSRGPPDNFSAFSNRSVNWPTKHGAAPIRKILRKSITIRRAASKPSR